MKTADGAIRCRWERAARSLWLRVLLAAAATAALGVLVEMFRYRCAVQDTRALLVVPFLLLYVLGCALLLRGRFRSIPLTSYCAALMLLALALLLRYALLDIPSFDYKASLSNWLAAFAEAPGLSGLGVAIGDYNVPYRYLLLLIAKVMPAETWLYGIKLLSLAFELILAYYVAAILQRRSGRYAVFCAGFFATLFLPTVFSNGAVFAQCDAIYAAFGVGALYYGLLGKSRHCYLMMALAFSFKLQTVFLMPMLLVLLFCRRIRLRDCWVFPAAFLALLVPTVAAGRNALDAFAVYFHQAQSYPELTLAAPSVFSLFTLEKVDARIFGFAGVLFAGGVCLALLLYLYRIREKLTDDRLLDAAFLFALLIPLLLPHMHERYFFCADVLACVYLFVHPRRWPVPFAVGLVSFLCCYTEAPYNGYPVSLGVMGIALLAVAAYAVYRFYADVSATGAASLPSAEDEA